MARYSIVKFVMSCFYFSFNLALVTDTPIRPTLECGTEIRGLAGQKLTQSNDI